MKMHWIEVDDKVFKYLQKHAEPFIDTPNSVLHRLLFDENEAVPTQKSSPLTIKGLPKSLSQIFEVLYEIKEYGYSRVEATNIVAQKRGTVPQTIMDKYCKQLNLKAPEVDKLLDEPGWSKFRQILQAKFNDHKDIIEIFFESLLISGTATKDGPLKL
jgi:negative regulator of replication initiation